MCAPLSYEGSTVAQVEAMVGPERLDIIASLTEPIRRYSVTVAAYRRESDRYFVLSLCAMQQ
jgi:hypothetical protein